MAKAALSWRILLRVIPLVPQGLASRLWGRIARVELPRRLQGRVNRTFARGVGANLREAELGAEDYASLAAFFTRGLRPGARTWPPDGSVLGSPADGILGAHGSLDGVRAVQAKGLDYSVAELLGSVADGDRFRDGVFLTIYLSPRHYHRVHAPCSGRVRVARAIPGRLLPVAPPAVASIHDLFPRNERLVVIADCGRSEVAVVAVGAFNVGAISADFDPEWGDPGEAVTNQGRGSAGVVKTYEPPVQLEAGGPLLTFHLGSTVIVLARARDGAMPPLDPGLREGDEIRAGTPLFRAGDPLGG